MPAPLSPEEQDLLTWLLSSIPRWFWMDDPRFSIQEVWGAVVKALITVQRQGEDWVRATYILTSTDVWTNQHARDRGTFRQGGESDSDLQQRLRTVPEALTRASILNAIDATLTAAGVVGEAAMLELPRDGAWLGTYTQMFGTGGTFAQDGTTSKFTPDALPWPAAPHSGPDRFPLIQHRLTISGAVNSGNNGTRLITGLVGDAVATTNALGLGGVDPGVTWQVQRLDALGNQTDGFARSFCGRGWRVSKRQPRRLLVILPFGTSAGTQASVEELVRTKKGAGFGILVERRVNP